MAAFTTVACSTSGRGAESKRERVTAQAVELRQPAADHAMLRAVRNEELSPALIERAEAILEEHADEPFGYEVPFELDGKRYLGRIEEHYHPPGSHEGPNGEHVGVTLYVFD